MIQNLSGRSVGEASFASKMQKRLLAAAEALIAASEAMNSDMTSECSATTLNMEFDPDFDEFKLLSPVLTDPYLCVPVSNSYLDQNSVIDMDEFLSPLQPSPPVPNCISDGDSLFHINQTGVRPNNSDGMMVEACHNEAGAYSCMDELVCQACSRSYSRGAFSAAGNTLSEPGHHGMNCWRHQLRPELLKWCDLCGMTQYKTEFARKHKYKGKVYCGRHLEAEAKLLIDDMEAADNEEHET